MNFKLLFNFIGDHLIRIAISYNTELSVTRKELI
jgi:hypothetical protein